MNNNDERELAEHGDFGIPAHVIKRDRTTEIWFCLNEYRGTEYIDIRQFFRTEEGMKPTRRGVTIPTRNFKELYEGVIELGGLLGHFDPEKLDKLWGEPETVARD